jgi:hypothetical protein
MDALKVERAPICTKVRNAPSLRLVADVVVGRPVEINADKVRRLAVGRDPETLFGAHKVV